ncbi:uncharacterized protein LOC128880399 [Hylaeus volcanicus]|uniref:uncharacterized protein LOC128880399 n=1 Tax=Hylaeus volcanicus TaxID=313075 RepID=UPI0023B7BDCB|nr:uncharacterized protein LOC128880399 [Hylaeus volcanicus]XP_053986410.1 uncharacterized protein LOC128880399 [Hylaeus volcanicus]XP_053986411.1 uncharacterized protein LOC128880399 [Hylaeus volcanicus]XP_053986412.1 uncharacterized protein LOC128880399 [Hylaeus volcanicus]XP_053986414.1 uncharacterized protein LOC128880399 [Hylaeus volcanicus]XP_053986415.1 uncharacterized protein LOC128880399 [Hylaeus volcanicus]
MGSWLPDNTPKMLQNCSGGGSRRARRALLFVFVWGLVMIAAVQFRHVENTYKDSPIADETGGEALAEDVYRRRDALGSNRGSSSLGLSRYLLQRSPADSSFSNSGGSGLLTTLTTLSNGPTRNPLELEPLLDKRPAKTEEELIQEIEQRLPSLPLAYWSKNIKYSGGQSKAKGNDSCSSLRYPSIYDIEFNNIYWQTMRTTNGTFQFFGAFYDRRKLSRIGPAIRIVGMIDRIEPTVKTHCQLWYDGEREPKVVETLEYKYIWYPKWGNYKQGIYQPYVIACKVPLSHWLKGPPASVSMVEKPCDTASNNLRVIYNKPEHKKDFAVCVKGLDFLHEDLSVRLVEWIELITLLGADKIFFYQLQVHPNVTKVLDHYQRLGKVHVTPLTLPGGQPNVPAFQHMYLTKKTSHKRQNELIPYNDCLYKHMYEYEYIALLDVDEVIMPVQDATWQDLMKRVLVKAFKIRNETRASYNVRNVYFLDDLLHSHGYFKDIPKYMHMLQHVYRSKNFTKPNQYIKCFHNPERVVTLHNHFPLACLGSGCTSYPIETEDAQLQHYRADCVSSLKKSCVQYRENSILDTTVWRYKDQLIERVTRTLETLGFFGPS